MWLYKIFCIQIIYNNAIKPCFSNSSNQSEKAKANWERKNLLKNKNKMYESIIDRMIRLSCIDQPSYAFNVEKFG